MARFLVDTQVWLWLQAEPERIDGGLLARLSDSANELLLSAASSWEIAIKHALGRLELPAPPERYVPDRMRASGTTALAIEHAHTLRVASLPHHHRDLIDRMLVAQAQSLGTAIVTADDVFELYDVEVIRPT